MGILLSILATFIVVPLAWAAVLRAYLHRPHTRSLRWSFALSTVSALVILTIFFFPDVHPWSGPISLGNSIDATAIAILLIIFLFVA